MRVRGGQGRRPLKTKQGRQARVQLDAIDAGAWRKRSHPFVMRHLLTRTWLCATQEADTYAWAAG